MTDRLHPNVSDFESMVKLGQRPGFVLPAVPSMVIAALKGRGVAHIVPTVFATGDRGASSWVFATDGSGWTAYVPSHGLNPWARSPEGLCAALAAAGVTAVIVGAPDLPQAYLSCTGQSYERPIQPYVVAQPDPIAAAPAKAATKPASAQLDLFGAAA